MSRHRSASAAITDAPGGAPGRRLALVLWSARIGGAETLMRALAERFVELGVRPEVVIIGGDGPLVERLREAGISYRLLGLRRGRDVLRHPRRVANAVGASGPDGALLIEIGYLGACLRVGGYKGVMVAVEHGSILFPSATRLGRTVDRIVRALGAWADDGEVAVSDLVLERMRREPHASHLRRIHNGVDPDMFAPGPGSEDAADSAAVVLGCVGRMVPGKGLDFLIRAVMRVPAEIEVKLLVAGDGPERERLAALARSVGAGEHVEFLGLIGDVQEFWRRCDVAVVPSERFIESFCLSALEAAACGKPLIATRQGALPELVRDGVTGTLVAPGDIAALSEAITTYALAPTLRHDHGVAGRAWTVERFGIDRCARAYLELFDDLGRARSMSTGQAAGHPRNSLSQRGESSSNGRTGRHSRPHPARNR